MVQRKAFIEIGRVAIINYGPDAGKLAVIVDIVDSARALIDGHVTRQTIPLRNLSLTDITVPLGRAARTGTVQRVLAKAKVADEYEKTNWAKKAKLASIRASLSDFARFKNMILKKKRNNLISRETSKLRRASSKSKAK